MASRREKGTAQKEYLVCRLGGRMGARDAGKTLGGASGSVVHGGKGSSQGWAHNLEARLGLGFWLRTWHLLSMMVTFQDLDSFSCFGFF